MCQIKVVNYIKEPIKNWFIRKFKVAFRFPVQYTHFLDLTFDFYKQASQNQQFPKVSGFMPIHSKNTKEWMYLCTACVFVYILHPYMGNR